MIKKIKQFLGTILIVLVSMQTCLADTNTLYINRFVGINIDTALTNLDVAGGALFRGGLTATNMYGSNAYYWGSVYMTNLFGGRGVFTGLTINGSAILTNLFGSNSYMSGSVYTTNLFGGMGVFTGLTVNSLQSTNHNTITSLVQSNLVVGSDSTKSNLVVTGHVSVIGSVFCSNLVANSIGSSANGTNYWSGQHVFNGNIITPSNDLAVSYLGYPRVPLITTMVSASWVGWEPAGAIPVSSFIYAFDTNRSTSTSIGTNYTGNGYSTGIYTIDLGVNYFGFVSIKIAGYNSHGDASGGCYIGTPTAQNILTEPSSMIVLYYTTSIQTNSIVIPVDGRYIRLKFQVNQGFSQYYNIQDISLYGITNSYRNVGGY